MQTLVWQKNVVVDKYYGHTCSWKRVKGLKLYFTSTTTFSAPWMLGNIVRVMLGGLSLSLSPSGWCRTHRPLFGPPRMDTANTTTTKCALAAVYITKSNTKTCIFKQIRGLKGKRMTTKHKWALKAIYWDRSITGVYGQRRCLVIPLEVQ